MNLLEVFEPRDWDQHNYEPFLVVLASYDGRKLMWSYTWIADCKIEPFLQHLHEQYFQTTPESGPSSWYNFQIIILLIICIKIVSNTYWMIDWAATDPFPSTVIKSQSNTIPSKVEKTLSEKKVICEIYELQEACMEGTMDAWMTPWRYGWMDEQIDWNWSKNQFEGL